MEEGSLVHRSVKRLTHGDGGCRPHRNGISWALSTRREAAGRMKNPSREEPEKPHFVSINLGRLPGGRELSPMMALCACRSQARVPSSGRNMAVLEPVRSRVVTHTAP